MSTTRLPRNRTNTDAEVEKGTRLALQAARLTDEMTRLRAEHDELAAARAALWVRANRLGVSRYTLAKMAGLTRRPVDVVIDGAKK